MMNIYDAVIIDLISTTTGNHLLAKAINDRKDARFHSPYTPKPEPAIDVMVDAIVAIKQQILNGDTYLEPIYHRAIALAVDTINLRAINSP